MSSGETAKSTASGEPSEGGDASTPRNEPTSDVSEVARRVADPHHAESAASSFESSGEAAAAARDEGESHDAADALDAYARISLPGAATASASDAASSNSFLAWLKSGKSATSRALEFVDDDSWESKTEVEDESVAAMTATTRDESEEPIPLRERASREEEPIPLRAKDSGNSLMTVVPSAAELAAVEASLDSLGVSRRPPPLAADTMDVASDARDAGKRTSVEELTADEVIERISVEPVEATSAPGARPPSIAPPPPPPAAALTKPPTLAPPPLPKSVAPPPNTAAVEERVSAPPGEASGVGERISVPTLETLAGPTARTTTRPPAGSDDPLAMPSIPANAAALSLIPPALPLVERTTEAPPPKRVDKKAVGLTPPPSPKVSSSSRGETNGGGGRFFSGALGFVLGCVITAVAMRALTPASNASTSSTQAAVCAEPTSVASASNTASTTPASSESTSPADAPSTASSVTQPGETSTSATNEVVDAGSTAVVAPSADPPATTATVAIVDAGPAIADDNDRHHHHHHADEAPADTEANGSASTRTPTPSTTVANTTTTNPGASTPSGSADSTDNSPAACSRRCGGNADCLIACHRNGGTAASSTTTSASTPAPHETPPPVANDPPPEAVPDHATPSRDEVVESMLRIRESVIQCVEGDANNPTHSSEIDVTFTFAGSGRVTIALVGAPFAGTPAGSCIARAARAAHLEPFAQGSFRVTYPFRL